MPEKDKMVRIIEYSSRFLAACELLHMVGAETSNPHECREMLRKSQEMQRADGAPFSV